MNRKNLLWSAFVVIALAFAAIQFVPSPPLAVPANLPPAEREAHRLLNFEGIDNFRDLGGYPAADGRQVKWGVLYRTANLAHASDHDLEGLDGLQLNTLVDFRSAVEKKEEPSRLPEPTRFTLLEIPTLDGGNLAMVSEIMERIESGNFEGFDPNALMLEGNRQFANEFTPQFRQFIQTVLNANGEPVAWHCSAGKDRTGFAAAILLRILGVAPEIIMNDYLASNEITLEARRQQLLLLRLFKGEEAADKLEVLMGVQAPWLEASFREIDAHWGSFDNYVREGLGLTEADIAKLRHNLLVEPGPPV